MEYPELEQCWPRQYPALPQVREVTMEPANQDVQTGRITLRTLIAYGVVLSIGAVLFVWIRSSGLHLTAPAPTPNQTLFGQGSTLSQFETLLHLLLALVVIMIAARSVGAVFKFFGQPPVIGEVIAGILLGPSLLASVLPELHAYLLPASVTPFIGVIAQIGVILYMFLVGLELNPSVVRSNSAAVLTISHTSIIVPFLSGAALSLALYPIFSTSDVPFLVFLLFMGISMSVTAFPVLARILTDRGMHRSRLGVIALTCAAVDDVTAWCLLAFVVGVAKASLGDAIRTLALTAIYLLFMVFFVRRLMLRLVEREEAKAEVKQTTVGLVLVLLLLSAFTTEWVGIHALFGAFLLGAIVPPDCKLARALRQRLHDLVVVLFLPAYFAFTGMRTQVGLISGMEQWLFCALIILTASFGKFGGSLLAARFSGIKWREGAAIGVLMNTRGLMELIVLNIGYDLKVLSPTLFTMLVLMAVITTFATTPILQLLLPNEQRQVHPAGNIAEPSQ
jgi:Kef-type K+ transport system membrane component KefB